MPAANQLPPPLTINSTGDVYGAAGVMDVLCPSRGRLRAAHNRARTFVVPASHLYNVHAAMVARCLGRPLRACIVRGGELVAKGTGMRKEKKKPKKKK
jgi:hypothetical protein